jgi:hypothetical protein
LFSFLKSGILKEEDRIIQPNPQRTVNSIPDH